MRKDFGSGPKTGDFAVVAAGEMRCKAFWEQVLDTASMVLAADAGWHHLEELGRKPNLIVGDLDSIRQVPDQIPLQQHSPDKNQSDTQLAVETAFEKGAEKVWLLGGVGSRLDHTFANQKLLNLYPERLTLADGDFEIVAIRERFEFQGETGETCSLFSSGDLPVSISTRGLRYELDREELRADSHGVSNVVEGSPVVVEVHHGTALLFRIWEPFSFHRPVIS